MRVTLGFISLWVVSILPAQSAEVFQEPNVFLSEVFANSVPDPSFLGLKGEIKEAARNVLRRDAGVLRQRYWHADGRTAWILDEIGKTQPITTGISIRNGEVERVQILIYRESHGWEVRYPFFTDQFRGMTLRQENELSSRVDGISGATLSVRAITKLVRLALLYDAFVQQEQ